MDTLMDGRKALMTFTDPPYNVRYGESKNPRHKIREIEGDWQNADEWEDFIKSFGKQIKANCAGDVYVWGASAPDGMKMRLLLIELGLHWSATIAWVKQQLILSPAKYQRMYEPCLYGWFGDKSSFSADRKEKEVWFVDRPLNSKEHPTMKPVELGLIAIRNSSRMGDIVLDLFIGSGSTMVAAQQLNRMCYGMEIEPKYCAVTLERMSQMGLEPELV
jgi:DNA modification methylase